MDALGWDRASVLGLSEGGVMSQLFAAEYPDRVETGWCCTTRSSRAATGTASAGRVEAGDPPVLTRPDRRWNGATRSSTVGPRTRGYFVDWFVPSQSATQRRPLVRPLAAPVGEPGATSARQLESVLSTRRGRRARADHRARRSSSTSRATGSMPVCGGGLLADLIPGAQYVEIDARRPLPVAHGRLAGMADTFIEFCTGTRPVPTVTRRFATVLFTDIVGSTRCRRSWAMPRGGRARAARPHHPRADRRPRRPHGEEHRRRSSGRLRRAVPGRRVRPGVVPRARRDRRSRSAPGVHAGEIEVRDDSTSPGSRSTSRPGSSRRRPDGEFWASSTVRDMMLGGARRSTTAATHHSRASTAPGGSSPSRDLGTVAAR